MKAKKVSTPKSSPEQEILVDSAYVQKKWGDTPLLWREPPEDKPLITQGELMAYLDALFLYQLALADLEARRGAIKLKLLQLCDLQRSVDPGGFSAYLNDQGELVVVKKCNTCLGTEHAVRDGSSSERSEEAVYFRNR